MDTATRHKTLSRKLLLATALSCAPHAVAGEGELHPPEPRRPEIAALLNVSIGLQQWSALGDLDAQPFGTYDTDGMNLSGSAHVPWRRLGRGELLAGMDLGLMVHESDITAPGDIGTIDTDVWYFVPSLRWSLRTSKRVRWNVEAGAGAYRAEMSEWIESGWDIIEGTRHWKAWAPGGFVGASVDLDAGRPGRWSVNSGVRMHYADFGNVDAFGTNVGALDGPIFAWQLGFTYDWNGE